MHAVQTVTYEQMLQRAAFFRWSASKCFPCTSHVNDPITGRPMQHVRGADGRVVYPGIGSDDAWRGEERAANVARARYWLARARAYRASWGG